jgi:hypothetical protein
VTEEHDDGFTTPGDTLEVQRQRWASLTPNGVVLALMNLARELAALSEGLDALETEAVNRREDYTLAYASAFIRTPGAMDLRKQIALQTTHPERLAAETAEALVRGARRQVDSIKVRISVGRTAAATLRAELTLAGSGVGT